MDDDGGRGAMRPLDPLLLGSFPAPPTHIPVTPTSPNPPPSRPPSSPLPPVPGPSSLLRAHSISAIDVHDILEATDDDDDDDDKLSTLPPLSRAFRRSASPDIAAILSTMTDDDTRSWIDHDEFGRPLELDDSSDSSIDLHTPLPHLMMRHGLLSPNSRLITQPSARDSVVSLASTTSRPLKDARDTAKRRVRHRDGRLLRGGLGLTTGLGWSDSEDEDAPSPLTRRISSLDLSNRSSASSRSSSGSSLPKPAFSRSFSSASLRSSDSVSVDEFGKITSCPSAFKGRCSTGSLTRTIPEAEELDSTDDRVSRLNREKSLPPIPPRKRSIPVLRSSPNNRARSISGASSASSGSTRGSFLVPPSSLPDAASPLKTPRPLRLPSAPFISQRQRPRPSVPGISPSSSLDSHMRSPTLDTSSPSTPSTPSPITPSERPRPRVGTGMTYRSSSSSNSRIRLPSSMSLNMHQNQKPIPL